jgi:RNA polymerase sigma-70 factor (ECF subfamily)
MSDASLDSLLARVARGDNEATERLFRTYEPYLRMVVRRQLSPPLRAKFDSVDIIQSVWADVVQGFRQGRWQFADADRLRGFLFTLVSNRFVDRVRQHNPALQHEEPWDHHALAEQTPSDGPRPSQVVRADELWQRLLELSPPAHHEVLHLRRAGHDLQDIASRTGMHPSSIRRILYDLARRLEAHRTNTARG